MAKDYNIDDILSEVKKRREENEQIVKGEIVDTVIDTDIKEEERADEYVDQENPMIMDDSMLYPEDLQETIKEEDAAEIAEETLAAEEKISEETADVEEATNLFDIEATKKEMTDEDILQTAEEAKQPETEMVDLFAISEASEKPAVADEIEEEYPEIEAPKKKKKHKTAKIIIAILVVLIVIAGAIGGIYVSKVLNTITPDNGKKTEQEWKGMEELIENFNPIEETDASQLASLQDMIKTWYYNGSPSSSSHVLNILLVGEDTRGNDILESGTRADSAMICSINIDTHKVQLTSVLRDTYAYWENEPGNKDSGTFNKINAAMSLGDISVYKNAVENLYKVKIDNYVIVNFDSFEAIVDAMGGVTLELTAAEIREINNHPKRYNHVSIDQTFDGNKGKVKLNGKQALAYCRIRKLDSDNMRANRQKICLQQIAKEAKDVSPTTLIKMADKMVPYIKTDMSKSNILKVAKYALKQDWLNYDVNSANLPEYRLEERGAGGNFPFAGSWIWKADFPMDAYMLQMRIYGQSPITLARTRVDYINCAETGYFSEGAPAVSATLNNEHYGEATTLEPPTEEETESTTVA